MGQRRPLRRGFDQHAGAQVTSPAETSMADWFDVAARLAEGQPAVEHTQTYVQACQELGYQHPDLTGGHASSQVGGWYESQLKPGSST